MKPKIFIASSKESLEIAELLQVYLEFSASCKLWTQNFFVPSEFPLESLESRLDKFDYGIFIFTPDDILIMRKESHLSTRDNVIFELGMFIGKKGRKRCFIVTPRNVRNFHLPTDLLGVNPITYDPTDSDLDTSIGPVSVKIKKAITTFRG